MARAHSDDLRCKVLQAYERSGVGLEDLAEQFGVGYGFTKKNLRPHLSRARMERPLQVRILSNQSRDGVRGQSLARTG
jgi:hypothetical protein